MVIFFLKKHVNDDFTFLKNYNPGCGVTWIENLVIILERDVNIIYHVDAGFSNDFFNFFFMEQ
jgi:hypothetical protein